MAYTKTNWVNEGPPAIDADNLNKIENSVFESSEGRISLDTTASPGTTDGDLYAVIHALLWDDVID